MTVDLSGKVALVTGARTGLGAAIAQTLGSAGATVVASGRRDGDCAPITDAIAAAGGKAQEVALDVADLAAIPGRIAALIERTGRLDIIVNNAGVIEPMAPIGSIDPLAFDAALRTNVSGPAAIVGAAWPHLEGGGRIINILSGAALGPLHGWAAYCAGKAALLMFTRAADLEGKERNIRSIGFAPGLVDTDMQAKIRAAHINQISDIPQSKLTSAEIPARAVAWLASGAGDDYAGTMVDVRNEEFRARAGL
ncbi:MAG: SDR family NAD(P)-dependent oxidoreductase [Devosia sp.]